jgi:hypothetical protein
LRFGNVTAEVRLAIGCCPMSFCRLTIFGVVLAATAFIIARPAAAEPAFTCKFNGPEKTWQLLENGVPAKITLHECVPGGSRDNGGIERITVIAAAGQSAMVLCAVPRVAVLDELQARIWVNSSRPDIQLALRVVMPRSLDAQRRGAATAIVRGSTYSRSGHWQELRVAEVPKLLAEQVRIMRATPGAAIDAHEAYVDAVVLIVPGNPNGAEMSTDDLVIDGVLLAPAASTATASNRLPTLANASAPTSGEAAEQESPVRLQGTTLVVDGRPFLPRVITWNGEPLQFLASCGFNVVQLKNPPTSEQSAEAQRCGIWFLCEPPHPDALARAKFGRSGDRVLAWIPRDDALEVDSNYAMRWAELVRERDSVFGRPLVFEPRTNWAAVSKASDIVIAQHARISALSGFEFKAWLTSCPARTQPGTPLWVALTTQCGDAVCRQVRALGSGASTTAEIDESKLETLVQIACMHGIRGFVFHSTKSLSETDEPTRGRAAMLQLNNRRLQLIEPWLAGGKVFAEVTSSDGRYRGYLLHVDRARLLMPLPSEIATPPSDGNTLLKPPTKEIVFTVPGVPETSQVFYLSSAAMRSLPSQRIAGGTNMSIPGSGDGFVLMTEDPQVIQSLRQRVARDGAKLVQLERDMAVRRARAVVYCGQKLTESGFKAEVAARGAATVNQQLAQIDSLITSGQGEQAHETLALVGRQLDEAETDQRRAIISTAVFESNPLAASFSTLAEYASFQRSVASLRPGGNQLVGGDFEDLGQMTQLGWEHMARPSQRVQTSAQLSAVDPQQGKYCLEMSAAAYSGENQKPAEDNAVWIVSPPIPVSEKQVIEITGWVRIDRPFEAGQGLKIEDSLGGPALSLIIGKTYGWQPFRILRAGTELSQMRMTLSVVGLGAVKVDGVMVRTLDQPVAKRLPPAGEVEVPKTAKATDDRPTRLPDTASAGPGLLAPPAR